MWGDGRLKYIYFTSLHFLGAPHRVCRVRRKLYAILPPEQLVERDYCDGKFFLNCADLDRANYSFSYNGE